MALPFFIHLSNPTGGASASLFYCGIEVGRGKFALGSVAPSHSHPKKPWSDNGETMNWCVSC
jgi:hypothetical protein